MRRASLLLCAAALLGACGTGESPEPETGASTTPAGASTTSAAEPAPRTLTPADTGGRFTLATGSSVELVVADAAAADPTVEGDAVLLVPVVNIDASDQREWELRAVSEGTSTVTSADPSYSFVIVVS